MSKTLLLPALQGQFGDWLYYATTMPLSELRDRVHYAREIHQNAKLSDMIQRRLDDEDRARDIAEYLLETKDRFFGSLVVGVMGGEPQWHPFDVEPRREDHVGALSETSRDQIGYLELSGGERLFALDGQHRLAGIRRALETDAELGVERVSVLFVPHQDTAAGLKKTRGLFIALNKKAVQVKKRDIIALDEVDPSAIIARMLVDAHPAFSRGQIDVERFTNSLPAATPALTTISNFYDLINVALPKIMAKDLAGELTRGKRLRLADDRIAFFTARVVEYFDFLAEREPLLKAVFDGRKLDAAVAAGRHPDNPRLLFRPLGLTIATNVIVQLRRKHALADALKLFAKAPLSLAEAPFRGVIWNPDRGTMNTKGASLATRLLLHMLGEGGPEDRLRRSLADWHGIPLSDVQLPDRLV
ncbi:DNA sulfur modification protein DndB [Brevundimonas sp.]|uniref:DNA sulfur modification protein DndB n=1 Tax=Brevundimonas sp. TaxID=1871086 RepID=UPI003F7283C1